MHSSSAVLYRCYVLSSSVSFGARCHNLSTSVQVCCMMQDVDSNLVGAKLKMMGSDGICKHLPAMLKCACICYGRLK